MIVTVLHHPEAGEAEWPTDRLKAHLAAAGVHGRYCMAGDEGAADTIRRASGVVLVVGGDGTVTRAALLLDRAQTQLAIMPTGGANNIARSLRVDVPPDRIASVIGSGASTRLHIGEMRAARHRACFVEAAGIGALTRAMQIPLHGLPRPHKRSAGRDALRDALLQAEPCRAAITIDGVEIEEPSLVFEFMNIAQIGPGLRLASRADAGGKLSAVWLPVAARDAMLDWLARPHASGAPVQEVPARRIRIRLNGEPLRLDDEVQPDAGAQAELALQDEAIRVLVPEVNHEFDTPA
jgi:diacylglycerol kinase family enzyme